MKDSSTGAALKSLKMSNLLTRGKPELAPAVSIAISSIEEDPENVRRHFDSAKLDELADSIKIYGVKTPISVKPHATKANTWLINHGARRFRAAKLAGLTEIPAHLDNVHDEFAQLIENVQREDLTELEISEFIDKMKNAGHSVNDIARRTGKPASWVSRHTDLHNSAQEVLELVRSGRIQGAESIQLANTLFKSAPDALQALSESLDGRITQKEVRAAVSRLNQLPEQSSDSFTSDAAQSAETDSGKLDSGKKASVKKQRESKQSSSIFTEQEIAEIFRLLKLTNNQKKLLHDRFYESNKGLLKTFGID